MHQKKTDWHQVARGSLKAEMALRGLSYEDLAASLAKLGIDYEVRNLTNKINRGTFSAAFYFQCLHALGVERIDIGQLIASLQNPRS